MAGNDYLKYRPSDLAAVEADLEKYEEWLRDKLSSSALAGEVNKLQQAAKDEEDYERSFKSEAAKRLAWTIWGWSHCGIFLAFMFLSFRVSAPATVLMWTLFVCIVPFSLIAWAKAKPTKTLTAQPSTANREVLSRAQRRLESVTHVKNDMQATIRERDRIASIIKSEKYRLLNTDWHLLEDTTFELFLVQVYECLGYRVNHTGKPGDGGADLIVELDGRRGAIQAKGYPSGKPVGNDAVQQAHAGKDTRDCDYCMVITNSTFTAPALRQAEILGCEMIDRTKIEKLILGGEAAPTPMPAEAVMARGQLRDMRGIEPPQQQRLREVHECGRGTHAVIGMKIGFVGVFILVCLTVLGVLAVKEETKRRTEAARAVDLAAAQRKLLEESEAERKADEAKRAADKEEEERKRLAATERMRKADEAKRKADEEEEKRQQRAVAERKQKWLEELPDQIFEAKSLYKEFVNVGVRTFSERYPENVNLKIVGVVRKANKGFSWSTTRRKRTRTIGGKAFDESTACAKSSFVAAKK